MRFSSASICSLANSSLYSNLSKALVAASILVVPCAMHAQTAHFGGAITTLGSGFGYPTSVAVDASGNVFVADVANNAMYEIEAVGGIVSSASTVITIGSGFANPQGVAVDASGNVFVADFNNSAVKEILAVGGVVSASSTVITIGSGFANPGAVAVDASGNVFVADTNHNAMKEILAVGGVVSSSSTVIVIGSGFNNPDGVALDASGNVFVSDTSNNAVKEILAVGGVVSSSSTVITIGSGFIGPNGLTVDASGDVFVADFINNALFEIVAVGGVVSSSSAVNNLGGGLNQPYGVALNSSGQLYVADSGNGRVIALQPYSANFGSLPVATGTPATQSMTFTFDSGGTIDVPGVFTQGALALDFVDAGTGTCTTNGILYTYNAGDTCTVDVTFTPTSSGVRYGAAILSSSGVTIATAHPYGTGIGPQIAFLPGVQSAFPGSFLHPTRLAVDSVGNVFVSVAGTVSTGSFVQEILAAGGYVTVNSLGSGYSYPEGLAVDGSGNVFVADTYNNAVKVILAASGYTTVNTIGSGFFRPYGVALDANGNVFVADQGNNTVKEISAVGGYTTMQTLGSGFSAPRAVAVDASGNVFVADTGHNTVKEIMAVGGYAMVTTLAPAGGFYSPTDLSLDGNGNLYVLNSQFNIVEELFVSGGYTTSSFIPINVPQLAGVTVDAKGNLFVTGNQNSEVDELDVFDPPSLQFASTTVGSSSASQTVTVTNNGNSPLTFEVPSMGLNPSISADFTFGNGSTCPQLSTGSSAAALATGASCTELVSFTPTAPGSITGSLATTDNALNAAGPAYATQTVVLSGTATAVPIVASISVASTALTQGHAATAFTPVTASGGTGTLTFTIAPALPAGLVFSATGTVSGTPTAVSAATTYTVTITDTNGATTTATFSLTVDSAITATTATVSTALTVGHAAMAFTPVTASGGTGTLTFTVAPALPAALIFSATGAVSGTPTVVSAATTYAVTITDTNGATTTASFSLAVNSAITATITASSTILTQGHAATAFTPVTASGGTGTLTYTVAPALPAALVFSATGVVSGTPTAVSATTTYTVTITDANGATTAATFSLAVNSAGVTTSTSVASSSLTPAYGSTVVLTATVTPAPTDTPPGTVSFSTGSTLLGTVALDSAGVATLSIALPLGPNVITAVYSGSANSLGSTSSALSISNRASTAAIFSASPTTQLYNNPIVLTAQVTSSTAGTLGGTMSFLDGTTVVATVPLGANGNATYSVATLADGSHSLTAAYSGDGNFLPIGSTGAAVAITVGDVNLNLGGDQNQTVLPGAAVAYTFPLSPLVTPTFLYDVHLTATGLPPGATYTFSPAMIPAGSASVPVTLTFQTAKGTASLTSPTAPGQPNSSRGLAALAFGLLLPLLGAKSVRKRLKAMPRPLNMLLFTALSLGAIVGITGCGSSGFYGATVTSGKYTITVTAISADLVRTSTVQLTIQ